METAVFDVDVAVESLLTITREQARDLVTATKKGDSAPGGRALLWDFAADADSLAIQLNHPFRVERPYVLLIRPPYSPGDVLWQLSKHIEAIYAEPQPLALGELVFRALLLCLDGGRIDFSCTAGVAADWVDDPDSAAIAADLNASDAAVCPHGRRPCNIRCGVWSHAGGNWSVIPKGDRLAWLQRLLDRFT